MQCFFDFLKDVSHQRIGFGIVFGRDLSEKASKAYRFACDVLEEVKKTLRDIQSRVSPTPDETWPRKVVSRLRETVVSIWGAMAGPEPDPASPEPRLGVDSIYSNSRSTAQSGRYVICCENEFPVRSI